MIIDSHRNPFYLFFLFANTRKSWTWHIGYKWTDSNKRVQFILKLHLIWENLFTQPTISRIQLWRLINLFYLINFITDRGENGFENMTEMAHTPALHISLGEEERFSLLQPLLISSECCYYLRNLSCLLKILFVVILLYHLHFNS